MLRRIIFAIICILYITHAYGQGGGPPMLTDDPGTVAYHKWEINTAVLSSVTNNVQLAPYIDANYGIAHNVHLKVEAPYWFTLGHPHTAASLGDVIVGVKYLFIDQDKKNFLSAGTYPQYTLNGDHKGVLLPLLLEKTIGKWMIGTEEGYFEGEQRDNSIINGDLVGYIFSAKFQVMAEYFLQYNFHTDAGAGGFMNYGFRYTLNNTFTLIGSFGTEIQTPANEQRQYFISFLGVQSDF